MSLSNDSGFTRSVICSSPVYPPCFSRPLCPSHAHFPAQSVIYSSPIYIAVRRLVDKFRYHPDPDPDPDPDGPSPSADPRLGRTPSEGGGLISRTPSGDAREAAAAAAAEKVRNSALVWFVVCGGGGEVVAAVNYIMI